MKHFDYLLLSRVNDVALSCSANIRSQPEHFQVEEVLPFKPDGSGGHVWLKIQKRNINTDWLANELAKFASVPQVAVGYGGLKDRHAITIQWFSINMEGHEEPEWAIFESDEIQILEQTRHGKKLKRGVLRGNNFKLRLTNIQGDKASWQASLQQVQQQGVPNYFGEQRFGHQGNNLQRVSHWFSTGKAPRKRNQKSIYLSAARSWLFNLVLAERIQQRNWNQAVIGDVMSLTGTKASLFTIDGIDNEIQSRVEMMDIHPTGPMWGQGKALTQSDSLELEQQVLADWTDWQQGLEKAGLNQQRRPLRLFPNNFEWQFIDKHQLELNFFLVAGSYATAIMRELAITTDVQQRNYLDN
ncbi:MAG: tRNA pseudouridine(13) synthase TruD [Methylophagaceae bacterium]